MRTFDELVHSANALRQRLVHEGKEPSEGVFTVYDHENAVIKDQPGNRHLWGIDRTTFFGMRIHVIK